MSERLVPLILNGVEQSLAVSPADYHRKKLHRKADGELVSYAEAGYRLGEYYENKEPYDGPKTKAAFEKESEGRKAARSAPKAEPEQAVAAAMPVDAPALATPPPPAR